jgi:hypothetical protein
MLRVARIGLFVGFVIGVVVSSILFIRYLNDKKQDVRNLESKIVTELDRGKVKLEERLKGLEEIAENVVAAIRSGKIEVKAVSDELLKITRDNINLNEIGVAFTKANSHHRSPFIVRKDGVVTAKELPYDHTDSLAKDGIKREFFFKPLKEGKTWNEPYFGGGCQAWLTEISIPFYLPGSDTTGVADGVVYAGYSLDNIVSFMDSLSFGDAGYAFTLSRDGYFLYYPQKEYVTGHIHIDSLINRVQKEHLVDFELLSSADKQFHKRIIRNGEVLRKAAKDAMSGKSGCVSYTSIITNQPTRLCYKPLANIGWTLFSLTLEDELAKESVATGQKRIVAQFFITLTLLILVALVTLPRHSGIGAFSAVLILCCSIWIIWYKYSTNPPMKMKDELRLLHSIETEKIIDNFEKERNSSISPKKIPTGVFVQSIEFNSALNFKVSGYIWQKYHKINHKDLVRGVIFPEAEDIEIEKVYEHDMGEYTLVGYYFNGTIREKFNYKKFPFDRELLWLRLWPKNFDEDILLVPDFTSFDRINPIFKPGLEESIVLPGWSIDETYFSYNKNSYNCNFGIENYSGQVEFPELYYNIGVSRNYFNAFISHLIPLLLVYFMLYAILYVARNDDKKDFGFSPLSGISATSAMFFVVVFNHISLRDTLAVNGVVYFEWFYFVTYAIILYVAINSIMVVQSSNNKIIAYKDNYYSRILFWPVTIFLLFVVTVINFY